MKVDDSFLNIAKQQVSKQKTEELQKQKAANDFEEIFARHLVKEMTKDSFRMTDKNSVMGSSGSMYREHITDALASELAKQRKLGMADLVARYWSHSSESSKQNSNILNNEDAK